jgi:saccharopine dehydrogenase-like NADP-dependent oxidoreductase
MGSTPGITNVMAGALAGGFDAVEEIHVRVASVESGGPAPFAPPYALDTVLDEFALEPVVFAAGRAVALPPMSGAEPVDFPTPIGRVEAIHTLHSEIAMFPRSFPGLREASFKVAFAPEFVREMRLLVGLGFAETEPLVGGVAPREMLRALVARLAPPAGAPADCDVLRVEVRGRRGGAPAAARAEAVVLPHPRWRVAAGALDTGVPLSIVGQMLARREIAGAGVLCPETCVPPAPFFAQLARRGIEVIP